MRGRPRKKPNICYDSGDSDVESDIPDTDGATSGGTSRKRKTSSSSEPDRRTNKRTRKKRAVILDDSDDDASTQPSTSGVNSQSVHSDDEISDSGTVASPAATTNGTITKRKRGRPRKTTNKQSKPSDDSDDNASPEPSTSGTNSQQRKSTDDDSDFDPKGSDSDSDAPDSDYTPASSSKKATARKSTSPRGKGFPARASNRRLQTTQNSYINGNSSPRPSTSGLSSHKKNDVREDSDFEPQESDSGSETPDSDYMPVDERSFAKKSTVPKRKGRPVRSSSQKKSKIQQTSVNGTSTKSSKDSTSYDPKYVETLAQKCVYFLLIEDQKKYAIKRKAIVTHVFKDEDYSPKLYTAVILKANKILRKTFGMELMELENQKDGYLIINLLRRELCIDEYMDLPRLKHQQNGLILYLLTVIFMNGNCITEDDLVKALKPLNIDFTSKKLHPIFGDVKKYITTELVKQMYLNYECICKDPPQYEIKWGVRAKEEVDKTELLQFACQIIDDTSPESWILQYKDAEESANQ